MADNKIYKDNNQILTIQAETKSVLNTKVEFFSFDSETARFIFKLQKDRQALPISNAAKIFVVLKFIVNGIEKKRILDSTVDEELTIQDSTEGTISLVIPSEYRGYAGMVTGGVYVQFDNGQSLDCGYFRFTMKKSMIDEDLEEMSNFYVSTFESLQEQILTQSTETQEILDTITTEVAALEGNYAPQLNTLTAQLADIDTLKIEKGRVTVADIDKNKGKFDQTYMSPEFLQQMAGSTPINAVPAAKSITQNQLAFETAVATKSRNLFNKSAVTLDKYVRSTDGVLVTNTAMVASDFIPVTPASKYTLSHSEQLAWYDANKVYISGNAMGNLFTATSPDNAAYLRVSCKKENVNKFQVEKGLYRTKYVSGEPVVDLVNSFDVNKLREIAFDFLDSPGKNLFNKEDIVLGRSISSSNGATTTNATYFYAFRVKVEPSTSYFINEQSSVAFYDANETFISGGVFKGTFTTPANVEYLRFSALQSVIDTLQLEKGTAATEYTPYGRKISAKQLDLSTLPIGGGTAPAPAPPAETYVNKYPFDEKATVHSNATTAKEILSAIKDIKLYGTNKALKYRIDALRRNSSSSDGNTYWVIQVADSSNTVVASFVGKNYVEPNTLTKVYLNMQKDSGVSGHVWIDWKKLPTTLSITLLPEAQTLLDEQVYLQVNESNSYNGNIRNLNDYYWKNIRESAPRIRALQEPKAISFTMMADSHIEKADISTKANIEATSALAEYADVDFIVHLGDMVVGDLIKEESLELCILTMVLSKKHAKSPVFAIRGNHDRNDLYPYTSDQDRKNNLITNKEWYQAIVKRSEQYGIVLDAENPYGGYYYKDFPAQKIRAIFANTSEMIEVNGVPELPKYAHSAVASTKQLKWLANTALKFTNKTDAAEWATVVFSHIPHVQEPINHNYGSVAPDFVEVIQAFKDGTVGSLDYGGTPVPYDFSAQGAKEFIGFFHGHVHEDIYVNKDGINHFISNTTAPAKRWDTSLEREYYGEKALSANTVVINREKRMVNIVKTGVGSDFQFTW